MLLNIMIMTMLIKMINNPDAKNNDNDPDLGKI